MNVCLYLCITYPCRNWNAYMYKTALCILCIHVCIPTRMHEHLLYLHTLYILTIADAPIVHTAVGQVHTSGIAKAGEAVVVAVPRPFCPAGVILPLAAEPRLPASSPGPRDGRRRRPEEDPDARPADDAPLMEVRRRTAHTSWFALPTKT